MQGSLLQIDIAQIIVDEGDEPNSLVDFLDTEALSGQDGGNVDFLSVDADTAAGGDEDVAVVEGVFEVGEAPLVLVAIDISKLRNDALIEGAGDRSPQARDRGHEQS